MCVLHFLVHTAVCEGVFLKTEERLVKVRHAHHTGGAEGNERQL